MESHQEARRTLVGVVASDKMEKTVVVQVERIEKHPVYKKYVRRRRRYHAHDSNDRCRVGDKVMLVETKPLSKRKRWAIQKVLEQAR